MVRRDLIGIEEQLLERYPELAAHHAVARRAGAQEITAVIGRFDAAGETDAEAFVGQVSLVQRTALEGYAASVRGLLPDDEVARWITVRDALELSAYDALLGDVDAPGAALLLDALEAVPGDEVTYGDQATLDQMLAATAARCECGYASSRVVPKRTCYFCAHAITEAWNAEERRLLSRLPALREELDQLFKALADRLAWIALNPEAEWSLVEHASRKAARGVARLNRAARGEIVEGTLASWLDLATDASHDYRPLVRSVAKRGKRTGLGAARLSTLALPGNPEVQARMKKRAQTR
ncbi:MAG: hypothetical protein K0R99_4520 [Microbacterium sp.]|uniref:hypothetical protein n=1 Tax=Microbacterium sp. TaxID=51671 RepID=UPI002634A83E|nr:hypothetical protein [Microbacterium sp.]MDF2563074.1 hypothetical protein [Microbacterium sp.]